jgi:hypothetical protein
LPTAEVKLLTPNVGRVISFLLLQSTRNEFAPLLLQQIADFGHSVFMTHGRESDADPMPLIANHLLLRFRTVQSGYAAAPGFFERMLRKLRS